MVIDTLPASNEDYNPTFEVHEQPYYQIARCKEFHENRFVVTPLKDGALMGIIDIQRGEWCIKPIQISYDRFYPMWRDFRVMGRLYCQILDSEEWDHTDMNSGVKVNEDEEELILAGGGSNAKLGTRSMGRDEYYVTIGLGSGFMEEFEKVVRGIYSLVENDRIPDYVWEIVYNFHPITIGELREIVVENRPRQDPTTDEESEVAQFFGRIDID